MVSRRKILSKSRDDLNLLTNGQPEETEDVWYQKEKLFKDHVHEVLNKWNQIDDEIWAKVIVLEKNRRVAKAYARAPVLTVNGSNSGFDGFRIGLTGFENPLRGKKTEECLRHIGQGVKIKMDESGNILIKRLSRSNIFFKNIALDQESAISSELLKLPHGAVESNKPFTLFDMKKFQLNIANELKRAYPNRRRLESQCLNAIAFVKNESDLLKCPIWMLIINMVAIDMLKSQIPTDPLANKTRAPIPAPQDEETYSVCGMTKLSSSGKSSSEAKTLSCSNTNGNAHLKPEQPPKLPPRKKLDPCNIPQPDYDSSSSQETSSQKRIPVSKNKGKSDKSKNKKKPDDPYYCGLRARIPNFVAKLRGKHPTPCPKQHQPHCPQNLQYQQFQRQQHNQQTQHASVIEQHVRRVSQVKGPNVAFHPLWHARSLDSGLDTASSQSPYNNYMFYRFQAQPSRGYIPVPPGTVYIGEWD